MKFFKRSKSNSVEKTSFQQMILEQLDKAKQQKQKELQPKPHMSHKN